MSAKNFPKIPDAEFEVRMRNLKNQMEKNSLDLLVVYGNLLDPAHVRYLSDFSPINESAAVVIPLEGEPLLCCGAVCRLWAHHTSRIKDIRIMPELGEIGVIEYESKAPESFSELLKEIKSKYTIRKVGVVGSLIFPSIIYNQIGKVFPEAEIVEAEKLLYNLRTVKSKNEVGCMRKAAKIMESCYAKIVKRIKPGMTEFEIAAEIEAEIISGGAEDHTLAWSPMIPIGAKNANLCVSRNTSRKTKKGEIICLQAGALYEGYNATLNTPFVLGKIPKKIRDAVLAADEAMTAIIDALKPEITAKELNDAGRAVLKNKGYGKYCPFGLIHSTGMLECEPPWFKIDSGLEVIEGMTVCINVYLFGMPWGSFRLEDTFAIHKDGAERLTKFNTKFIPDYYG